jgi:hypothetical protein
MTGSHQSTHRDIGLNYSCISVGIDLEDASERFCADPRLGADSPGRRARVALSARGSSIILSIGLKWSWQSTHRDIGLNYSCISVGIDLEDASERFCADRVGDVGRE